MNDTSTDLRAFPGDGVRLSRSRSCCLIVALLIALVPLLAPFVSPHDARLLMYPYGAALDLLPAALCVLLARRDSGIVRAQWLLMAGQFLMRSLSLWAPTLHLSLGWPSTRSTAWLISGFASASIMFCLLALTAFAGKATKSKRILDGFMTLILCGLNFLIAFSTGPSGFSHSHLQVTFITVAFLLLAAEMTRRTAVTDAERRFAGIVTIFLVSRVIMLFFIDIVANLWFDPPRELPFDIFFGLPPLCFSLLALRDLGTVHKARQQHRHSALLASLIPSMVFFASVGLALHAHAEYPLLCSLAIALAVICFVLRTHLLYGRMLKEQQLLVARTGQLETLATHDALTGIGNRRWLEQVAAQLLPGNSAALLLIDVDRFKWINDTFGHRAGDDLLLAISDVLRDATGAIAEACCARIGGDEFVALLPRIAPGTAKEVAERMRWRIKQIPAKDGSYPASASIGVAVTSGEVSLATLLELADQALYRAKRHGRNLVEIAAEESGDFVLHEQHGEVRRFRA